MSGVAGGSRINKQNVQKTFSNYESQVLKKIPGFKQATLSGSVKVGTKPDYGDLDLIVYFEGNDKKEVKQRIIDLVLSLPDNVIVPFKSDKYAGKKYYNSGEIISVLYPIDGVPGKYIQVDNIISLTQEEFSYKGSFLDLPAEIQGLLIGLAKVIFLEEDPKSIFNRLGIKDIPPLVDKQEYEFNLASGKLTLRLVTLDGFKETARTELWSTTDWGKVTQLFENFNTKGSFEELLSSLNSQLKNPRSKKRIAGVFKSMVSVKSGEVGTPKGDAKTSAISKVDQVLAEQRNAEVVALYAGGFKPPHRGHFENALALSGKADKLIIFIGRKPRPGEAITPEQAMEIWQIYARHLPIPSEFYISPVTPIKSVYDWVDGNQDTIQTAVVGLSPGEEKRYEYFVKNKDKYPKVEFHKFSITTDDTDDKLSATNIRLDQNYLKSMKWAPTVLSPEEKSKVYNTIKNASEQYSIQEQMNTKLTTVLENLFKTEKKVQKEVRTLIPNQAINSISSKDRNKLVHVYNRLRNVLYEPEYDIAFKQDKIVITVKNSEDISKFNYTPYMASLVEYMMNKGVQVTPLPEIKIRQDLAESVDFFGKTAHYDPVAKEIVLYVMNRHPKDVMRSFSHEMIHHHQNLQNRLQNISTQNVNEDDYLMEIEEEAMLIGNKLFRSWEDTVKSNG